MLICRKQERRLLLCGLALLLFLFFAARPSFACSALAEFFLKKAGAPPARRPQGRRYSPMETPV